MQKEWSLSNDKAIINFTKRYCTTHDEVLDSEAFRSVLKHFLKRRGKEFSRIERLVSRLLEDSSHPGDLSDDTFVSQLTVVLRLLVAMDIKMISTTFPKYAELYDNADELLHLVEEIYNYWLGLERYSVLFQRDSNTNLSRVSFMDANTEFKRLILSLYRLVSYNINEIQPAVFRQITAGTNCGMVCHDIIWPVPSEYEMLKGIPFIDTILLETPFITYPKRNKREGFFHEVEQSPLARFSINKDSFFCFPVKVGGLMAFVYVHRDFLTHGVSLANLFQLASENEVAGRRPDMLVLFGADNDTGEQEDMYFMDSANDIAVGILSHHQNYDYFGYMKKMMLTLHNVHQIHRGNLPIHGAMVNIVLKGGKKANVVIMGDSGAGKSESIEAFRSLADEYISDMTIIFDDMGTFVMPKEGAPDPTIKAYGTEIGAFVRLDDLDSGYAFKQLFRSIFMNPDKINARLINPVSTYDEIMVGEPVDIFLYANNYDAVPDGEKAISFFKSAEEAIPTFKAGQRMAKGTTQEKGITTSYFANPFGPMQNQERCDKLIDAYYARLFENGTIIGELRTQLGVEGKETQGPEQAAIDLFELIKTLQ